LNTTTDSNISHSERLTGILCAFNFLRFYRAMHFSAKRGLAIACRPYVCLSVLLSVTLVITDL